MCTGVDVPARFPRDNGGAGRRPASRDNPSTRAYVCKVEAELSHIWRVWRRPPRATLRLLNEEKVFRCPVAVRTEDFIAHNAVKVPAVEGSQWQLLAFISHSSSLPGIQSLQLLLEMCCCQPRGDSHQKSIPRFQLLFRAIKTVYGQRSLLEGWDFCHSDLKRPFWRLLKGYQAKCSICRRNFLFFGHQEGLCLV